MSLATHDFNNARNTEDAQHEVICIDINWNCK
jgi:hypothetical protein